MNKTNRNRRSEIVRGIVAGAGAVALCLAVSACGSSKKSDTEGTPELSDAGYTGEPCGTIPIEGKCSGTVARYCAGTTIWEHDCASDGEICIEDEMGAICGEEPGDGGDIEFIDVCQGISEMGVCDRENNAAVICQGGAELITLECTPLNARCTYDSETGHAVCADVSGCGEIGEEGVCRGTMSVYCWDDILYYEECGETAGCGWSIEYGNYCLSDELGAGDCGNVTSEGECAEGHLLSYCEHNTLYEVDCVREGFDGCGYDTEFGEYICFKNEAPAPEPCGSITTYGTCADNGSTLKYCNDHDELTVISCAGGACGMVEGFADCIYDWMGQDCGSVTAKGLCLTNNVVQYCLSGKLAGETCGAPCKYDAENYAVCP